MKRVKTALFLGRFQPPSIAHVATLDAILTQWPRVLIIVFRKSPVRRVDARWYEYISASSNSFNPRRLWFKPAEIKHMWDAYIATHNLSKRIKCSIGPRPFTPGFNTYYPSDEYDIVYPSSIMKGTKAERLRYNVFSKVLEREVFLVKPAFTLHGTDIRNMVLRGVMTWRECIPGGAYDIFTLMGGPDRIKTTTQL